MKVIGLTGGIGSGKSLVAYILKEKHNAHIINTDQIAKDQMQVGGASYNEVVSYFGQEILNQDGSIDRERLAQIIFLDKEKRNAINQITHPKVLEEVKKEIEYYRRKGNVSYAIIETALMIESGYTTNCDEVWYVHAPEEQRRNRLKKERNYSEEKMDSIIQSQSSEEDFFIQFKKVIYNTGDIQMLEEQIELLLHPSPV